MNQCVGTTLIIWHHIFQPSNLHDGKGTSPTLYKTNIGLGLVKDLVHAQVCLEHLRDHQSNIQVQDGHF